MSSTPTRLAALLGAESSLASIRRTDIPHESRRGDAICRAQPAITRRFIILIADLAYLGHLAIFEVNIGNFTVLTAIYRLRRFVADGVMKDGQCFPLA